MAPQIRIAFYHNHKEDIGHLVHLLRIIAEIRIRRPDARIHVFQAGKPQPLLERASEIHWIHLPRPFYSRAAYFSTPRISRSVAALRARFLAAALARLRPDVFITDFFPFGRRECGLELAPSLERLASAGIPLLSCVPMPYFTHPREDVGELLEISKLYRTILIHTPAELDLRGMAKWIGMERRISPELFLDVFHKLRSKLRFTGYVLPPVTSRERRDDVAPGRTILVHRGGGSTSAEVIAVALRAKKLLDPAYCMLLTAGPATTEAEMCRFKAIIAQEAISGVTLRRFIPSLIDSIRASAVCVGTAGGTAYELLYYGKKTVVIPFAGTRACPRADQPCRAELLEKLIGATRLDGGALTPPTLADAIRGQLLAKRSPVAYGVAKPRWFEGGSRSAEVILAHAGAR